MSGEKLGSITSQNIYNASLWLFGILAALAIERAADKVLTKLIFIFSTAPDISFRLIFSSMVTDSDILLLLVRFVVFLVLIIRFYLGSVFYYQQELTSEGGINVRDTLLGGIHFSLFLLCSMSIDLQLKQTVSVFECFLIAILLYDSFWFLFRIKASSSALIRKWATVNMVTIVLAGGVHYLAKLVINSENVRGEAFALGVVFIFSILDLIDISKEVDVFKGLVKACFPFAFKD